jgi:hypothetical protein
MSLHIANKGIQTSNFGLKRVAFHFNVGAAGAVGTIYQAGANFVLSVTQTATGVYTVQLNKNYPTRIIHIDANIATPLVGNALVTARPKAGSYSATAGTFVVFTSGNTGAGDTTQIAADPADGAEVHVVVDYIAQTVGIGN